MQAAYDVLSDPEKRKQYDRFGSTNGARPAARRRRDDVDFGDFDLGDIFGGLFGGGRRRGAGSAAARPARQRRRGRGARLVRGLAERACRRRCRCSSSSPATPATARARRRERRRSVPAVRRHAASSRPRRASSRCSSRARAAAARARSSRRRARPATARAASGGRSATRCKIPAGVKDGTRIKLKGKGEAGYGGAPAGDLYVVTRVEPSKLYERRGDDLVVDGARHVPDGGARRRRSRSRRPTGRVSLKVPSGSEDGKLLRIKGRGAPRLKGAGKGDLLARLRIEVPKRVERRSSASCSKQLREGGSS